jgi:hypothetical protein
VEINCKTYQRLSNSWVPLTLALLALFMYFAVPLQGQTPNTTPPAETTAPPAEPRTMMPPVSRDDNDTTNRELASMDRFMDSHPEIAEQLRKDPSLIDDRQFIENHPALQQYLQEHPRVREEFRENPNAFMRREERYERREDRRGDHDITQAELASMDRFMDSHPEIAEQLRKDPSLVDNRKFVDDHPALQEYLQNHPQVREEFKENPNAFMRQEERYDRREDAGNFRDHDRDRDHDRQDRGEINSFGDFLRGHSNVADQLSKDPSLANNKEFLTTHPELQTYLSQHPEMQQQLATNPRAVMTSPRLAGTTAPGKTYTTDPKPTDPKPKDKQSKDKQ